MKASLILAAACAGAVSALSGPLSFVAPAQSYVWPKLNSSFYWGWQPTTPAFDADGAVYLSSNSVGRCGAVSMQKFVVGQFSASTSWSWDANLSDWCVAACVGRNCVSDAVVSNTVTGGAVIAAFNAQGNNTQAIATIVYAFDFNGNQIWSAILPQYGVKGGPVLVSNGSSVALIVGTNSNATVYVLDAASGTTKSTFDLPANAPGCNGSLTEVDNLIVGTGSDGSDVLIIDGYSIQYSPVTLGWAVTGPRAGQFVFGFPWGRRFAPQVAQNQPNVTYLFYGPNVLGAGMGIVAVSLDTTEIVWNISSFPGSENFVSGAGAAGSYLIVMASYSVWRGCSSPAGSMYAINASNGAILNSMPLTHFPDISSQNGGAMLVVPSSSIDGSALIYWRETNGWGQYDSYLTAGSFSGSYFLITSRYHGDQQGTNIAHDDQGQNAVRGCPPSVDTTPGMLGFMQIMSQGQLLITDWSGFQLFLDNGAESQKAEL